MGGIFVGVDGHFFQQGNDFFDHTFAGVCMVVHGFVGVTTKVVPVGEHYLYIFKVVSLSYSICFLVGHGVPSLCTGSKSLFRSCGFYLMEGIGRAERGYGPIVCEEMMF